MWSSSDLIVLVHIDGSLQLHMRKALYKNEHLHTVDFVQLQDERPIIESLIVAAKFNRAVPC